MMCQKKQWSTKRLAMVAQVTPEIAEGIEVGDNIDIISMIKICNARNINFLLENLDITIGKD